MKSIFQNVIIFAALITFSVIGCTFSGKAEASDQTLFLMIRKSSDSCDKFVRVKGKYSREVNQDKLQKLVPTEIRADSNFMYLIKRTPKSVSKLSKNEMDELKGLLKKRNYFSLSEKDWFSEENDVIIPIYLDSEWELNHPSQN